jgi:hypothetical protein
VPLTDSAAVTSARVTVAVEVRGACVLAAGALPRWDAM